MLGGVEQRRPRSGHALVWHNVGQEAEKGRKRPARRSRGRAARALRWGLAGFLLGAAGWIWIGVRELLAIPPGGLNAPGCTTLAIDRDNGPTTASPCSSQTPLQREALAVRGGAQP